MTIHPIILTAVSSLIVALLAAAVTYLVKGLVATGALTKEISTLVTQLAATAAAVENLKKDMLTQVHLENAILRLKLELTREVGGTRVGDKA